MRSNPHFQSLSENDLSNLFVVVCFDYLEARPDCGYVVQDIQQMLAMYTAPLEERSGELGISGTGTLLREMVKDGKITPQGLTTVDGMIRLQQSAVQGPGGLQPLQTNKIMMSEAEFKSWMVIVVFDYLRIRPECRFTAQQLMKIMANYCIDIWPSVYGGKNVTTDVMRKMIKDGNISEFGIDMMDEIMRRLKPARRSQFIWVVGAIILILILAGS